VNPFWLLVRVAGISFFAAAGTALLFKNYLPKASDVMAGAIHFRKGLDEFRKGFTTIASGAAGPSSEETKKTRESTRVLIE
jgi:hypothetical protein